MKFIIINLFKIIQVINKNYLLNKNLNFEIIIIMNNSAKVHNLAPNNIDTEQTLFL